MIVGALTIRAVFREARSLKDKRHVLKGFKDRVRDKFNVSIAEVDEADSWQSGEIGIAVVANESRFVHSVLSQVVDYARGCPGMEMVDHSLEIFTC
jgi:uncharacterized protein YlxP (DUF503 family)